MLSRPLVYCYKPDCGHKRPEMRFATGERSYTPSEAPARYQLAQKSYSMRHFAGVGEQLAR